MNNSPTIRFANTSQKIYRGHIPDAVLDTLSVQKREQKWQDLLDNNIKVLVIEHDNNIIGFASLCPSHDKDTDPKIYGEISAIYLHPDVWYQGLGKKLCTIAISELEKMGFSEVIVWILKENDQARKFYEAMDFNETGHSKLEPYNQDVALNEVRYRKNILNKFTFKPLQEKDLELLCKWLNEIHIKEWWDDKLTNEEIKSKYKKRISDTIVVPFIVCLNDNPIGFIQYYQADKVGDGWWPEEQEGTIGIDQFIGEKDLINRGIGTKMIRAFIDHLFINSNIKKIITDVDPKNFRAIHCYEKIGFKFIKEIMTPDGPTYVMVLDKTKMHNPNH